MIYSIQDTTLTAIGDALRAKTGETRPVKKEYEVFNYGINSFDEDISQGEEKTGLLLREYYTYPENTAYIIVKCKYYASAGASQLEIAKDMGVNSKYCYGSNKTEEIRIEGNEAFIQLSRATAWAYAGCYGEVRGYDADGNLVLYPSTTETEFNGYKPEDMAEVINSLEEPLPESVLTITGNCDRKFYGYSWDWFIRRYGDRITTSEITNINNMFYNTETYGIDKIPFDINLSYNFNGDMTNVFQNKHLKSIPLIKGDIKPATSNYSGNPKMNSMFSYSGAEEIPDDYFSNFGGEEFWESVKLYNGNRSNMFCGCNRLKELPDLSLLVNQANSGNCLYYSLASYCSVLRKINNLPVIDATFTSNCFYSTVNNCYYLKDFIFATDNGTPKTANWKSQTIELNTVGVAASYYTKDDKTIIDDATYQALKNDPDSWTMDINYSRYNHDSAVATINSLPDTSAYLANAGGTNTIKFNGASGAKTDGGAINTLTEEEIAVATAKGWTVSLT